MNHRPSVRSLFSGHRTASVSLAKRTSSISNAIRTASVGTAYVGNSKFHIAMRNSNEPSSPEPNQNAKPLSPLSPLVGKERVSKKESVENANVAKKSPYFSRRSPFITRKTSYNLAKENANLAKENAKLAKENANLAKENANLAKEPACNKESVASETSVTENSPPNDEVVNDDKEMFGEAEEVVAAKEEVIARDSPKTDRKKTPSQRPDSDNRLSVSELFAVYSRITRRKLSKQDAGRASHGTWGYRGSNAKPRPSLLDSSSPFSTLPRNCVNPTLQEDLSHSLSDDLPLMSLAYAKLLKLRKQKEELKRIYSMLDDLENDFMGSKENNTFIERYMEVKVKKDYMLSPGNPESTVEQEDTIKVFGYMGHNTWRILGPYCKGYCKTGTVVNPRIRSQNQVADVDIVCNSCNKITVPLIGSVPTSILHMRNANHHSPG